MAMTSQSIQSWKPEMSNKKKKKSIKLKILPLSDITKKSFKSKKKK